MSKHEDREMDCERADAWLEALVDGEVDPVQRRRLQQHVERCRACAAELELAQRIRAGLRALPVLTCTDRVRPAGGEVTDGRTTPFRPVPSAPPIRWRSVLALAAMLALILALPRLLSDRSAEAPSTPGSPPIAERLEGAPTEAAAAPEAVDPALVAAQEAEVKLALAYLGQITDATRHTVGHEVLGEKLMAPLGRSLRDVLLLPSSGGFGGERDAS